MVPALVLPWAMVLYTCGYLAERAQPLALLGLLVALLPVFALVALPWRLTLDRWTAGTLSVAVIGILYLLVAVGLFGEWQLNVGKLATYCGALVLGALVAGSPISAQRWLHTLAIAALVTFIYTVACDLTVGVRCFTLGNVNFIGTCAAPVLFAWAAWAIASRWCGHRVGAWHVVGLAAAAVVLVTYIFTAQPGSPRRAILLSGGIAACAAICAACWSRWRGPTLAACAIVAAIAIGGAAWMLANPSFDPRADRILIYRGAVDGIAANLPFGNGAYSALGLSTVAGESARFRASTGLWTYHAHNELLDALLNYGVVGGACAIALLVGLIGKCLSIVDPALRAAASALLAALWVHASLDTAFAYPAPVLWAGALVGFMLLCPGAARTCSVPVRPVAWVLAIPCVIAGAWFERGAAFVHLEASPAIRNVAIDSTCNPDIAFLEGEAALQEELTNADVPSAVGTLARLERPLRSNGPLVEWRLVVAERQVQWLAERATLPAKSPEEGEYLALHSQEADQLLFVAAQAYIQRLPFSLRGYQALLMLIRRRPEFARDLPGIVRERAAYLDSRADLPEPSFPDDYRTIDEAIDAHVRLYWMASTGRPWPPIVAALVPLVRRYGTHQDVVTLVLRVVTEADPATVEPLIGLADLMVSGANMMPKLALAEVLTNVRGDAQARSLARIFSVTHAGLWREFERGTVERLIDSDQDIAVRNGLARLRAMALRRAPEP